MNMLKDQTASVCFPKVYANKLGSCLINFDECLRDKSFDHSVSKLDRPPDESAYLKIIFFISHPKHMLWVHKRTVSMRRFF